MAKMTDDEFTNFVTAQIRLSLQYIDSSIAKRRERAMNYIQYSMPDLPSLKGRSSVVDGTLPSQLDLMMPGLMRVLCGGPLLGEYTATHPAENQAAKEATLYVNNVVLKQDNDGEKIIYDWLWDGLAQIQGVIKIWWEEEYEEVEEQADNLSTEQLVMLYQQIEQSDDLEIIAHEQTSVAAIDPATGMQIASDVHSITVKRKVNKSHLCIEVLPPEEVVVSSDARDFDKAVLRSHRTYKRAGELKEMGYPADVVDALPTYAPFDQAQAVYARGSVVDWGAGSKADDNSDMRIVAVHQGIIRCNKDGKGIAEWYFVAGGNEQATTILECEKYDDQIFFADFCSKPIPHSVFGRCAADDLMPVQLVKTAILRQTLDNLYQTNSPQRIVVASQLQKGGLEALMNKVPNGLVLANSTEAVRDLATPFFAKDSFPMLSYFDDEAEKRTGVSRASMGLDPDVLQNQSATAANIAQSASMGKIEMIARLMATGGMRKMFRGILRMLRKYQDFPRVMKVGDELKEVDPRQWAKFETWDVTINTGLGTGSHEKDMAVLGLLAQKQEQVLLQAGPQNGIITLGQYANTLRKMVEAAGFHSSSQFIKDVPIEWSPEAPEQPNPEIIKVQAQMHLEQQKAALNSQIKQQDAERSAMLEREKAARQHEIEATQAQADLMTEQQKANLEMDLARQKAQLELLIREREAQMQLELKRQEAELQAKIAVAKAAQSAKASNGRRNATA